LGWSVLNLLTLDVFFYAISLNPVAKTLIASFAPGTLLLGEFSRAVQLEKIESLA